MGNLYCYSGTRRQDVQALFSITFSNLNRVEFQVILDKT